MSIRGMARLLALAAVATMAMPLWAAPNSVRAWLDRDTMQFGETVTLNVEAHGNVSGQPDFSALAADFKLLTTQSSRQLEIVNGKQDSQTIWAIGLEPKHVGQLTIPPLDVDGAKTAAIVLAVVPPPTGAHGKPGDDVYIEATAEPLAPYVQQQVRYTVRLFYALDLASGNLGDPSVKDANVLRLGQDRQFSTTLSGHRYRVLERHYAITPQRSGEMTLPSITFRGVVLDASDPMSFLGRGRTVDARSDAITLNVRPQPATAGLKTWLPATSLALTDTTDVPTQVRAGDPVTRTIRLQAQGLAYEALPSLELKAPDGAEIYPDREQDRTRDDGTWLWGERDRKFVFVPSRPGTLTLPGLEIRWWNTATDRAETTSLPSRTVQVLPALAGGNGPPSTKPAASASPPAVAASHGAAMHPASATPSNVALWRGFAFAALALWLATLAWIWRMRGRRPAGVEGGGSTRVVPSEGRAAFTRACAMGDLAGAERGLVAWARSERPEVRSTGDIARSLDDADQVAAIEALQRTRYAGVADDGTSARLQRAFRRGFVWRPTAERKRDSVLPELYPDSR